MIHSGQVDPTFSHKMDELTNELGMIDVVDERLASGFHPSSSSTASSTSTIGCHPNEFRSQSMDHSAVGCQTRNEGEEEEPSSRIRYNLRSNKMDSLYPDGLLGDANDRINDRGTDTQSRLSEASSNRVVDASRREVEEEGDTEGRTRVGIIDRSSGQSSGSIKVTQTQPLSSSPSNRKTTLSTSGQQRAGKQSIKIRGSASNTTCYNNNFPPHESLAPLIGANVGVVSRKSISAHDINLDIAPSCSGLMDTIMGSPSSSSILQGHHHGDRTSFDRRSLPGIGVPKKTSRNGKPVARSASILLRSKVLILSDSESEEEHSQSSRGSESRSKSGQSSSRKAKGRKSRKKSIGANAVKGFCPFGGETNYGNLSVPGHSGLQVHSAPVTSGKRKRSTTTSFSASGEHSDHHHHHHGNKMDTTDTTIDTMDMDNVYDSSSLSESSIGTDCEGQAYDEADDEQSDFYEVMSRVGGDDGSGDMSGRPAGRKYHHHHHRASKPMMVPRNPFATITASPPPGPSSSAAVSSSVTVSSSAAVSSSAGSAPSAAVYWKRRKRNQWQ